MKSLFILLIFNFLQSNMSTEQDVEIKCPPLTCRDSIHRTTDSYTAHCYCDNQCGEYHDCCFDAPNKTYTTYTTGFPYNCILLQNTAYFIKSSCLPNTSTELRKKCEMSKNYKTYAGQMKLKIPVTSKETNITYGNIFCAFCNNIINFDSWDLSISCGNFLNTDIIIKRNQNSIWPPELNKTMQFNNATKQWIYKNNSNNVTNCTMRLKLPNDLKQSIRECMPQLNSTCPSTWKEKDVIDKCNEYQSIVMSVNETYRNAHCALCNGVALSNLSCYARPSKRTRQFRTTSTKNWSNLLKLSTSIKKNISATPEVKPPIKKSYIYIAIKTDCANLLQRINLKKIQTETILYRTMNRTFLRNATEISGTNIQICQINNNTWEEIFNDERNPTFLHYIINVGCLCASVLLLLYIWNFFSNTKPKTTYQKLMLSYVISMLLSNVGFLYNNFINDTYDDKKIFCAVGIITYLGFLASIIWVLSMAFDISCTIWSFVFDQSTMKKINIITFTIYSIIGWVFSIIITLIVIIFSTIGNNAESNICLFQNDSILLWFFAFPLTVSVSINLAFYLCSVYVVYIEIKVVDNMLKVGIDFKLHTIILLLSNLIWLTIILAGYFDNRLLIMVFIISNLFLSWIIFHPPQNIENESKIKSIYSIILQQS